MSTSTLQETRVITTRFADGSGRTLDGYVNSGGYGALKKALSM